MSEIAIPWGTALGRPCNVKLPLSDVIAALRDQGMVVVQSRDVERLNNPHRRRTIRVVGEDEEVMWFYPSEIDPLIAALEPPVEDPT